MKRTLSLLLLAGLVGITGACAPQNPEKTEILQGEDLTGTISTNRENPSYHPDEGRKIYDDQNPNYLNIGRQHTQNTTGDSQNKLRDVVEADGKFAPGMIFTNGRKLYVYVKPKEKYSKEELTQHRKELEKKLKMAVARYEIVLTVRDNKG